MIKLTLYNRNPVYINPSNVTMVTKTNGLGPNVATRIYFTGDRGNNIDVLEPIETVTKLLSTFIYGENDKND